jgi:hypothetical protein
VVDRKGEGGPGVVGDVPLPLKEGIDRPEPCGLSAVF